MRKPKVNIQQVIATVIINVPERRYKSGITIPAHKFERKTEKQIIHSAASYPEQPERKFKYVGRMKPLNGGLYR